jgi:hypothetical protein
VLVLGLSVVFVLQDLPRMRRAVQRLRPSNPRTSQATLN